MKIVSILKYFNMKTLALLTHSTSSHTIFIEVNIEKLNNVSSKKDTSQGTCQCLESLLHKLRTVGDRSAH